jgi:transketolase
MRSLDMESGAPLGRLATRKAYGVALRALGETNPSVVVLDADVSNSTFAETFAKDQRRPVRGVQDRRAEHDLGRRGHERGGQGPVRSTFAKFVTRAYDQIEMAMNSGART